MVTIVSWNTLESGQGGAWADGWGCPLEIQRWKEELVQWKKRKQMLTTNTTNTISSDSGGSKTTTTTTTSTTEAEEEEEEESKEIKRLLTNQRYTRIRNTILNEMNDNETAIDFYLFQELTEGNTWDEHFNTNNDTNNNNTDDIDNNDHDHRSESESEFTQFPPSTYERVPCQEDDDGNSANDGANDKTVQRIYVRTESGWKSKRSYTLHSDVLEGGCLVEFQQSQQQSQPQQHHSTTFGVDHGKGKDEDDEEKEQQQQQQLFLVNLHGNSKKMRDPHLRRRGIMELWKEIGSYLTTNKNNKNNKNEHKNENEYDSSSSSSSSSWWWWMEKIIVCGDFNTHLSDLITPTRHYLTTAANSNEKNKNNNHTTLSGLSSSSPVLLEPAVGLLRNSTTTTANTGPSPVFSTNHEDGFLAQYDGCLFFRHNPHPNSDVTTATTTPTPTNTPISSSEPVPLSLEASSSIASSSIVSSSIASSSIVSSSSYLELENVSWNITGFMPKGHGKLPGSSSSEQQEEHPYYNNFTYHSSHRDGDGEGRDDDGIYLNGIFLGSGTVPSLGMSDHLRIYTTIRIHHHHQNQNNDHPIKEHNYEYEHQRRPPRHHSDTYN